MNGDAVYFLGGCAFTAAMFAAFWLTRLPMSREPGLRPVAKPDSGRTESHDAENQFSCPVGPAPLSVKPLVELATRVNADRARKDEKAKRLEAKRERHAEAERERQRARLEATR